MTLSLLQHLRETQGAGLVSETTQHFGLGIDKATGFINAALALVVGRLVNLNQTQGTSKVLEILDKQDTAALWQDTDFSEAHKELTSLGGLDDATSLQALNLVADRSLKAIHSLEQTASLGKEGMSELLDGQAEHLQGHFPDWIYAAAGLPALIGAAAYNTVKESVASLGSILRQAGDAIADTASEVAQKASEVTSTAVDTASEAASSVADKASEVTASVVEGASNIAAKTSEATVTAVAATGAAAASAAHLAGDAVHKTAAAAGDTVAKVGTAASQAVKEPASFFLRALPWVAVIILIILGLLFWKGCQQQTVPVAASTTPASAVASTTPATLAPATLSLHTGAHGELLNCQGTVGNADLQKNFIEAVQAQFGPAAKCDLKIDSTYATSFAGLAGLSEALGAIKASPNTSLELSGDNVVVNGPDQTEIAKLIDRLKALFGTGVTVTAAAPLDAATAVSNSVKAATDALSSIKATDAKAEDVIHALNLQVINFPTGGAVLPAENKAVLDQAATLIKAIPSLKLEITGHTDSTGDEKANVALSEQRAKSVAAYLVSKGVDGSALTAKGLGSSKPIADNATEQGKFQNRRISFALVGAGS